MRLALLLLATSTAVVSSGQRLEQPEIDAAIALGLGSKAREQLTFRDSTPDLPYFQCRATGGMFDSEFYVSVTGPASRIALAAFEAKRRYLPFTAADVTDDQRAAVLTVTAELASLGQSATHLVITGGRQPAVTALQPLTSVPIPVKTFTVNGHAEQREGRTSTFDLAGFRSLPEPVTVIVLATLRGERRCGIPAKMRAAIR